MTLQVPGRPSSGVARRISLGLRLRRTSLTHTYKRSNVKQKRNERAHQRQLRTRMRIMTIRPGASAKKRGGSGAARATLDPDSRYSGVWGRDQKSVGGWRRYVVGQGGTMAASDRDDSLLEIGARNSTALSSVAVFSRSTCGSDSSGIHRWPSSSARTRRMPPTR